VIEPSIEPCGDEAQKKWVLLTLHRRENFGVPLQEILRAVLDFARAHSDFEFLFPVHPNPNVKNVAEALFGKEKNIRLMQPLDYGELVFYLQKAHFILTDSGGIQEEAPSFGKPILVLRTSTERPEGVECGCAQLVGHNYDAIMGAMSALLEKDSPKYQKMANVKNPYGDGTAAKKIVKIIEEVA
jgi:UDP-N-acetylglucosamine 2-epimerase (non-hydrolysing)